jgi:hypothetical protein
MSHDKAIFIRRLMPNLIRRDNGLRMGEPAKDHMIAIIFAELTGRPSP